jgi:adenylate cyclase
MRGQILVFLGRFDEARPYLDGMLQTDQDPNDIALHLGHVAYVDLAWAQNDAALAERHAERAMVTANDSGSPYVYVSALACRGVAKLISGHIDAAADDLEKALAFARWRKVGLESEARMLTEVASTRAARVSECLARLVHVEILSQAGRTVPAELELRQVWSLIEETGARIYENLAHDLAQRLEPARAAANGTDGALATR